MCCVLKNAISNPCASCRAEPSRARLISKRIASMSTTQRDLLDASCPARCSLIWVRPLALMSTPLFPSFRSSNPSLPLPQSPELSTPSRVLPTETSSAPTTSSLVNLVLVRPISLPSFLPPHSLRLLHHLPSPYTPFILLYRSSTSWTLLTLWHSPQSPLAFKNTRTHPFSSF